MMTRYDSIAEIFDDNVPPAQNPSHTFYEGLAIGQKRQRSETDNSAAAAQQLGAAAGGTPE